MAMGEGNPALARIERDDIDLVILDLGLHDCDGMDVLAAPRRLQPSMPVLVLTARDAVDSRV